MKCRRKSKRRRPAFRLASSMIGLAVVAIAAWCMMDQPRWRGKAIATTNRAGGFVQFDAA